MTARQERLFPEFYGARHGNGGPRDRLILPRFLQPAAEDLQPLRRYVHRYRHLSPLLNRFFLAADKRRYPQIVNINF